MKPIPNLTTMFQDFAFPDRLVAAKALGFSEVEFLFPYDWNQEWLRSRLAELAMRVILFDFPAGNWAAGDRGLLCDPARADEFRTSVDEALAWAKALNTTRLNCLAGLRLPGLDHGAQWKCALANLKYAAPMLARENITLLIEPINAYDMPDYFLHDVHEAVRLIRECGEANVRLQFDIYHVQRSHGEVTKLMLQYLPHIAHIQLADNPGRHEPGTGELRFEYILGRLREAGYDQYIGLEYLPTLPPWQTLRWAEDFSCLWTRIYPGISAPWAKA